MLTGSAWISPLCLLWKLHRDPLNFLTSLHRCHGRFVALRGGPRPVYSLSDPELIREVLIVRGDHFAKGRGLELAKAVIGEGLLTSEGEVHRCQRRQLQPAFSRGRLEHDADLMVQATLDMMAGWHDGEQRDFYEEMTALSLDIMARSLFGRSLGEQAPLFLEALHLTVDRFQVGLIPIMGLIERLPLEFNRRFVRAIERLDEVVQRRIQERRSGPPGPDILWFMLESNFSEQQLRDETMTMFLAGHETTASALSWMMGLLGQHPEWAQRASHEVDQVLGSRLAAARDVSQLALCQGIWLEAMRLYPPAWMIGRRCLRPTHIGQESIPAGSIMILSQWVTHRDPQIYALPEQFCPQRWVGQGPPRLAYFPFGAGPRLCIGETFARLEGVLILASLLQRFRFRALGPELPRPIPRVTLEPRGGLPLLIEAR